MGGGRIDTAGMPADARRGRLPRDYDDALPEGAAIAVLFAAAVCVIAALLCAHLLVWAPA